MTRQALTCKLTTLCANEGGVPIAFTGMSTASLNVDASSFMLGNVWQLRPALAVRAVSRELQAGRTYPALHFTLTVHRRSGFYMVNVAIPMSIFALMSLMQWKFDANDVSNRLAATETALRELAQSQVKILDVLKLRDSSQIRLPFFSSGLDA